MGFRLSDQNVRLVHRLLTLLYQTLGSIPYILSPLAYFGRQRHAAKEMPTHILGEIGSASCAQVRPTVEQVGGEFRISVADVAGQASRNDVIGAVDEE
jgi:hypothetical protein